MNTTYESQGVRLAFTDTGSGVPVVFLHPTPLDGDYWRPVVSELAGIRAIVPDLRGSRCVRTRTIAGGWI